MREHVTPFLRTGYQSKNITGNFKVQNFTNNYDFSHIRWTLDKRDDLDFLNSIAKHLKYDFKWMEAIALLTKKKYILQKNISNYIRIGNLSVKNKKIKKEIKFTKSNQLFHKAIKKIPLASQTFSKSYLQFPKYAAPLFVKDGMGARIRDVDNNYYIDYIMGLLPIVLGYNDKDVNSAIVQQLEKGITFSLASELEYQLSETLCDIIPSAEMVRFGKNGSDANTAAIRLARAYTNREKVAVCGYHGWHDWYIGSTTRDEGVPNQTKKLTTKFSLENLDKIIKAIKTEKYAAIIMEPAGQAENNIDKLKIIRETTKKFGTVLIFDEIISGFRIDLGGAQKMLNIIPDISTFGKAMANGMPLSAIVGKKESLLKKMEEVFFSTTFGGETLSLAASIATIKKLKNSRVIEKIKIQVKD